MFKLWRHGWLLAGVGAITVAFVIACLFDGQSQISGPQAAVLGVVEGLTEYLPVSSTGHLILASHAMGLSHFGDRSGPLGREVIKSPAVSAFEIVIQFGAILAVIGLYRRHVGQMALGLLGRDRQGLRLLSLLVLSTLPALVAGLLLHEPVQKHLFGPLTVSVALVVGGVLMIIVERFVTRRRDSASTNIEQMAYWQALAIGVAQVLALWPGTSRSMVTILAAMVVGMNRVSAAEFSFLLALPTLGAATVYEAASSGHDLIDLVGVGPLLIGVVTSAVVAALAVQFLVRWLNGHSLGVFGVYRIAVGAAVLWYFRQAIFN